MISLKFWTLMVLLIQVAENVSDAPVGIIISATDDERQIQYLMS